jgi:hypothetical protein
MNICQCFARFSTEANTVRGGGEQATVFSDKEKGAAEKMQIPTLWSIIYTGVG